MKHTRLSLLHTIVVLLVSGSLLLIRPGLVFSTLQSNAIYPPELGNLLGIMFLGLGSLVALVFRYKFEELYKWTIAIRAFFSLYAMVLYLTYKNPFFIALLFIILIGILITVLGLVKDQRLKN